MCSCGVALRGEAPAVAREVEAEHVALLAHTLIVHDAVVLASVRASCVQEDDVLVAVAGLLVENLLNLLVMGSVVPEARIYLASSPNWCLNENIPPN